MTIPDVIQKIEQGVDYGGPSVVWKTPNYGEDEQGNWTTGYGPGEFPNNDWVEADTLIPNDQILVMMMPNGEESGGPYIDLVTAGILPAGLTWGEWYHRQSDFSQEAYNAARGLGRFGRGGGGRQGLVYVAPDERLVRDAVKGVMADLVGKISPEAIDAHVKTYLRDHRRDFDNKGKEIDPMASVVESIRGTEEYKIIHTARPEEVDEQSWVAGRVAQLINAGLSPKMAIDLGISQATAAASVQTVGQAAEVAHFQGTARMLDSHKQKMRQTMFAGFSLL
jgi:hypothetical protein